MPQTPMAVRPVSQVPSALGWPPQPVRRLTANRVQSVLVHVPWYGFRPQARLARDSGVSPSAVSRLLRGKVQPTLPVALRVTRALSERLGRPLDVFEVFSLDGTYPTASVCALTGCPSCLPPEAYDAEENLRPEFQGVRAGEWTLQVAPPTEIGNGKERA